MGGILLVRTFFYGRPVRAGIHAVTMSLLGLSEHGGWLGYYRSEAYRDFVLGGPLRWFALAILTLVRLRHQLRAAASTGCWARTLVNLLLGR